MKLRIQGNSLRLRVTPSEMSRLLENRRIEETIYFAPLENARLTYAIEHSRGDSSIALRWAPQEVVVVIPSDMARSWARSADAGLYAALDTPHGVLELAVEKDFACLDKSDAENVDTYPNPRQGTIC